MTMSSRDAAGSAQPHAGGADGAGRAAGPPRSPSAQRLGAELASPSRPLRAAEIYAAGKAEVNGHAPLSLVKPRAGSADAYKGGCASPLRRGSAAGGFVASPPPGSPFLGRVPSFSRQRADSGPSILAYAEEAVYRAGGGGGGGGESLLGNMSPTLPRSSVSAPSSQFSHTAPVSSSHWQPSLSHVMGSPAASPRAEPGSRSYQSLLASRLATAGDSASSNSSTASSAAPTPRDSYGNSLRPRPPGDPSSGLRPRRPSFTNQSPESSKHSSPSNTGLMDLGGDPGTPSAMGADHSPLLHSLSRPGSGRQGGINALVDAVRSKSEARLQDALEAYRQAHGSYRGINDRHALTGKSALHEAVQVNNIGMTRMLLKIGADPNVGHAATGPPLIDAASHGESGMVDLLLAHGAVVSAVDANGWTALHHACQVGHLSTAHVLIARGADLRSLSSEGQTPLQLAPPEAQQELLNSASAVAPGAAGSSLGSVYSSGGSSLRMGSAGGSFSNGRISGSLSAAIPPSPPRSGLTRMGSMTSISPLGHAQGPQSGSGVGQPATGSGASGAGVPTSRPSLDRERALSRPGSGRFSGLHPTAQAAAAAVAAVGSGTGAGAGASGQPELHPAAVHARLLALKTTGSPPQSSSEMSHSSTPLVTNDSLRSAQSSDLEDKHSLSPPPQLELPERVFRRVSSQGAGAADIAYAFEEQDAVVVQKHLRTAAIVFGRSNQTPSAPGTAATPGPETGAGAAAAGQDGRAQPAGAGPGSMAGRGPVQQLQAHLASLAAAVPVTPKFGFGCDVSPSRTGSGRPDAPQDRPASATPAPAASAQRTSPSQGQGQGQQGQGQQEQGQQGQGQQGQGQGGRAVAIGSHGSLSSSSLVTSNGSAIGSAITAAASCVQPPANAGPPHQPSASPTPPGERPPSAGVAGVVPVPPAIERGSRPSSASGTPIRRAGTPTRPRSSTGASASESTASPPIRAPGSGSAGPAGAGAVGAGTGAGIDGPPLIRDTSPVRSRPSESGAGGAGAGSVGGVKRSGAGASGSGGLPGGMVFGLPPSGSPGGRVSAAGGRVSGSGAAGAEGLGPQHRDALRISQAALALASAVHGGRHSSSGAAPNPVSAVAEAGTQGTGTGMHGAGGAAAHAVGSQARGMGARLGVATSTEALQARAIEMFGRSADVQTGSIAWTRGELIGAGAFGKVYAGLNQMTGELMAVKCLELLKGPHMMAQLEELRKELDICKTLSHEHIVGYIDSQYDDQHNTLFIFLEYVPGGSLSSMLQRFGKFKEELVRKYTRQLLLGLDYLHSCNIMHRDLKGGNVLVTRDGNIKLTDFGASKVSQETTLNEAAKSLKGSPFWMAPEVIEQTPYGRRADIWSLGCTVIEMLTGRAPWPDLKVDNPWCAMLQIVKRKAQGPPRPEHCSDAALDFLDLCFQVDPNQRPTASELLQHPFVAASTPPQHQQHKQRQQTLSPQPQRQPSFEFKDASQRC